MRPTPEIDPPDPQRPDPTGSEGGHQLSNGRWRGIVARAWRGSCPRCGRGSLFASTFRLRAACEGCGLVYRREQGAMTGQMYLSAAVTEILAGALVLAVFFATDWGAVRALLVSVPLVVAFSYWFLPKAMALWVAVEFMTDVSNEEPWAGP